MIKKYAYFLVLVLILWDLFTLHAQENESLVQSYLSENRASLGLTDQDISDWVIYNEYSSQRSGITHVHIRQRYQGIEVFNAVGNFAIKNGKVFYFANRLLSNISDKVNTTNYAITPLQSITSAATELEIIDIGTIEAVETLDPREIVFSSGNLPQEKIPVKLMYQPTEDGSLRLAWNLNMSTKDGAHWWSVSMNAPLMLTHFRRTVSRRTRMRMKCLKTMLMVLKYRLRMEPVTMYFQCQLKVRTMVIDNC